MPTIYNDGPEDAIHVLGISGGKDSTALALRMHELGYRVDHYVCTPTGEEPRAVADHLSKIERTVGKPITMVTSTTLGEQVVKQNCLPNGRIRWCTRLLKIEPILAWLVKASIESGQKPIMYVGFRADEDTREGIYSDKIRSEYPMKDWGWGIRDVLAYNRSRDMVAPDRTDCMCCFWQRIAEWYFLWRDDREAFERYAKWETDRGHTFRSRKPDGSSHRDSWPAALADMGALFDAGHVPATAKEVLARREQAKRQIRLPLFDNEDPEIEAALDLERSGACRVCTL